MARKETAYTYIDTHSGAGMYRLHDDSSQKTGEYLEGIAKLWDEENLPEILADYVHLVRSLNNGELNTYPGSPSVADDLVRRQDTMQLFELHPTDFDLLQQTFERKRKVKVNKSDGYQSLKALLPPPSRRSVVLIDPPYELKSDYQDAVKAIIEGYKRFNSGTYILWYPVVHRYYIDQMEKDFLKSNVRNVLRTEFCMHPDTEEFGMTGTGLFIVNPPWTLKKQLDDMLPFLQETIGNPLSSFETKQLIDE